jgi:hypothetical protein
LVKRIFEFIIILSCLILLLFWYIQKDTTDYRNNLEFIQSKIYNNKLLDFQNEVSVRNIEDIKWYYDKGNTICIEYGKILLKFKVSDFIKDDIQKELNKIFITTKQHKETKELKLYFREKELKEYVKK